MTRRTDVNRSAGKSRDSSISTLIDAYDIKSCQEDTSNLIKLNQVNVTQAN